MAFYELKCEKCGHHYTVEQSFAEHDRNPRPKCPKCRSRKVHQQLGDVHLQTSKKS